MNSILLILLTASSGVRAYVTSPQGLPVGRQMAWLKELTTDLVEAKPGELSNLQISTSHDLMYAWSHAAVHNKECALQVETLLKRVVDEREAGNKLAELDTEDYNCLLEGWAKSKLGEASAVRTEEILDAMHEQGPRPDLSSYKACLMAWRHSGVQYAAVRSQRILEMMVRMAQKKESRPMPDADCFDIVLQLWSRTNDVQAPQQTERLLGLMQKVHDKSPSASCKPRRTSFNAVLAAWSKSGSNEASDRVAEILSFMEKLAKADAAITPDAATFNIVMNTYARNMHATRAAYKADTLIRHVADVSKQDNEGEQLKPDTILFNTAMGLFAKSNQKGSYRKARSILDRQINLKQASARPDVFGITSVISCCAAETGSPADRNKAFNVAISTYQQMSNLRVAPNHVTYGTMLKACAKLLPPSSQMRRKWVRRIFIDAMESSSVGDMVVAKLREAATPDTYRELMQGNTRKNLPPAWTSKVNESSSYRVNNKRRRKRAEV